MSLDQIYDVAISNFMNGAPPVYRATDYEFIASITRHSSVGPDYNSSTVNGK